MFNPDLRGDPEERWRRIEQHLLLLDVDVKRLWGRVPQTIDQQGIPGMSVAQIQGGGTSSGTSSGGGTSGGGGGGLPDEIYVTVVGVDNGECGTPINGSFCLPRLGSFQIWQVLTGPFQSVTVTFDGAAWQVGILSGSCAGSGYQTGTADDINGGISIGNELGDGSFTIIAGCPSGETSSGGGSSGGGTSGGGSSGGGSSGGGSSGGSSGGGSSGGGSSGGGSSGGSSGGSGATSSGSYSGAASNGELSSGAGTPSGCDPVACAVWQWIDGNWDRIEFNPGACAPECATGCVNVPSQGGYSGLFAETRCNGDIYYFEGG